MYVLKHHNPDRKYFYNYRKFSWPFPETIGNQYFDFYPKRLVSPVPELHIDGFIVCLLFVFGFLHLTKYFWDLSMMWMMPVSVFHSF